MIRYNGAEKRDDRLLKIGRNRWLLIYGFYTDDGGINYHYRQEFKTKPTTTEVAETITKIINAEMSARLTAGFKWRDMAVWLSETNQANYTRAYNAAKESDGANLPVQFKFGTDEEPIYYTFEDKETLTDFFLKMTEHIQKTLEQGWEEKKTIDAEKIVKEAEE